MMVQGRYDDGLMASLHDEGVIHFQSGTWASNCCLLVRTMIYYYFFLLSSSVDDAFAFGPNLATM